MKNSIPYFWNSLFEQVNHPFQNPFVLQNYTGDVFSNMLRNSYRTPNENYETRIVMTPYSCNYSLQPNASQVEFNKFINESLPDIRSAFTPVHNSPLVGSRSPPLFDSFEDCKPLKELEQIEVAPSPENNQCENNFLPYLRKPIILQLLQLFST